MKQLYKIAGFLPFVVIVFLNAFVDLGHKIIIQNTIFKVYDGQTQVILTAIINGLMLLPFIFLFSPSGFISDRFPKHLVMRYGAIAAIIATLIITAAYYGGWFRIAFALTLVLAIQSAVYSPAKYGYIRELVGDQYLTQANAIVQAISIVGILGGTFVFSALFEMMLPTDLKTPEDIIKVIAPLGWLLVIFSIIEFSLTLRLQEKYAGDQTKQFSMAQYFKGGFLAANIHAIRENTSIWFSIIGISLFWALSQVLVSSFPAYAKEVFHITNTLVISGVIACSGIGVMLGSMIAGYVSRAHIELGLIPIGSVGFALGILAIPFASNLAVIAFLFLFLGAMGGFCIVPLNALIQYSAKPDQLGIVIAGNNWIQNLSMISFLIGAAVLAQSGINSEGLFFILAAIAMVGAIYTIRKLPHSMLRIMGAAAFKSQYSISVVGFDNLPQKGGVLLLGNHVSWIDWAMVQIASPRPLRFVMLRSYYEVWYLKPFFKLFGAIPISTGNSKASLETVNQCLKNGEVVCLFPEGAISRNGHLGVFHTGFEKTVDDVDGVIVPFYLHGLWGSMLSRSYSKKLRENTAKGLKRDIVIAFGQPLAMTTKADELKQKVFELSIDAWNSQLENVENLPLSWLRSATSALRKPSIIDSSGASLSNAKMIAATTAMAHIFKKNNHQPNECQNIGLLLPSSSAAIIANLAVMLIGRTAVNLNYTSSVGSVKAGIANAQIKTIYTSEKFVKKLISKGIDVEAMLAGTQVVNLEDVKANMPKYRLALGFVAAYLLPAGAIYRLFGHKVSLDSPAQILFSSGSEGVPKGIVLSHRNIMGNIKQISNVLNTQSDDIVMSSLPPFHSFGLTVTSLLPMVEGLPAVCHPDPTDALNIAKAVAKHQATIMCGTATFLRLYSRNRKVSPLMFESLRIIVAGAEKLSADVREDFELKFKKEIYEGYGATETTPVASVNVPDKMDEQTWKSQIGQKHGTVGLPLPGSCFRIVDPMSLQSLPIGEDGLILISGGQVMLGYLNDVEKTQQAIIELEGRRWYKTGDKGHIDADGFLIIVDRYSRFAKIGGEMVSLGAVEQAVEEAVRRLYPDVDVELAAASLSDEKKGEKVVVLIKEGFDADAIGQQLLSTGMNPLMIPADFFVVKEVPKLGSGKTDFNAVKKLALEMAAI